MPFKNAEDKVLLLLTFSCGALYERACVFWVHYSEKGKASGAVAFSMFAALVTIIGVEQFLKSPFFALVYILGFGAGTYFANQNQIKVASWLVQFSPQSIALPLVLVLWARIGLGLSVLSELASSQ